MAHLRPGRLSGGFSLLRAQLCPWVFSHIIPHALTVTHAPPFLSQNIGAGNPRLSSFPDGEWLREGMNFPSAQGELIRGPNLLPIKITNINSNKSVNIY